MGLSNELISQFAKITNDNKKTRVEEVTLYGIVLEYKDSICVKFDGSSEVTPVTTITDKDESGNATNYRYGAASVKSGDRVSVLLKNHSATITGNLSDPSMGQTEVLVLEDSITAKIEGDVKVQIDALGVKVDGALEVTNGLENGTTSINGGCIKTGTISAERIDTDNLKVKAANITGTLTVGQIDVDVPTKVSELENDSGYQTAAGVAGIISNKGYVTEIEVTTITEDAISTASISANQITTGTLTAASIALDGLLQIKLGNTTYGYVGGSNTFANGVGAVMCGPDMTAYVRASNDGAKIAYGTHEIMCVASGPKSSSAITVDSDRRLKRDISYGMEKYERFFSTLKPCFYLLNKDSEKKYRLGFIAQDVLEGALESGLTEDDLALLSRNGKYYGIGYSELIPLNTHMIQNLMKTVEEQDARITELERASNQITEEVTADGN